jgi:hypothetical protein
MSPLHDLPPNPMAVSRLRSPIGSSVKLDNGLRFFSPEGIGLVEAVAKRTSRLGEALCGTGIRGGQVS